jgi:predicted DNA-binding transcriptional regulator AlpA
MADNPLPEAGQPVHIPSLKHFGVSGVYFLYRDGIVVYVGQAANIRRRVSDHIAEGAKDFDAVSFVPCDQAQLDWLERRYIVQLLPVYNQCAVARRARAHYEGLNINLPQLPARSPLLDANGAAEFLGITLDRFLSLVSDGTAPPSRRQPRNRLRAWVPAELREFAAAQPNLLCAA